MHRLLLFITTLFITFSSVLGQQDIASPKKANDLFSEGRYEEAKAAYKELLEKYARNPQYNYYYGVTLLLTKEDYSEAIKRLRFANTMGVGKDLYYYLGRAMQLSYEFVEAKKSYLQFKKEASLGDVRVPLASKYIQECDFATQNISKYTQLTVVDKDTVAKKNLITLYHLPKSSGIILKNSDFFESGVDPNGIMYINPRQDEAYFSLYSTNSKGQDLYKMVKLLDGWSDNDPLPGEINTAFDEAYPYKQLNGTTLYFASNKPGGFGGYDLYKSEYNVATNSYSTPINMGVPFNSPDDDLLFVVDENSNNAWFASNRETSDDRMMVYKISNVNLNSKTLTTDLQQIAKIAKLDVSLDALKLAKANGEVTYQSEMAKSRTAPKINFVVNDTLSYTKIEQFQSPEALSYFKKGYESQQKRDSLNTKMREKRTLFQMSNDDMAKDKMVIDILKMEKVLYGYDDIVEESYFVARRLEEEKIRQMVLSGNYQSATPVVLNQRKEMDIDLDPTKYQFYSREAFDKREAKYAPIYESIFDENDINQLKHADSLYVWGTILTLEANSLMDKSAAASQGSELKFKRSTDINQNKEISTESLIEESKKLKQASIQFLLKSLDEKFAVYSLKIGELVPQIKGDMGQYFSREESKANSYYREASSLSTPNASVSVSDVDQIIGLKKMAVDTQDKILFDYTNSIKQGWTLTTAPTEQAPKPKTLGSYATPVVVAPAAALSNTTKKESIPGLIYKIQIGVFRNTPSPDLLASLPEVSSEVVEGKDLIKYYAGKYYTSEEAVSHIQEIKNAGFPGAYLVAFLNGQQIDLNRAKIIEDQK